MQLQKQAQDVYRECHAVPESTGSQQGWPVATLMSHVLAGECFCPTDYRGRENQGWNLEACAPVHAESSVEQELPRATIVHLHQMLTQAF